ncbi:Carbohydrate kinase PfkB [Dillenia turbinata]|uniref:Carbohydrate kinase PfkB n=1 Tax=Dillenia turbinata TaxID=194707 RepID=A0AAN8W7D5_9MAGN
MTSITAGHSMTTSLTAIPKLTLVFKSPHFPSPSSSSRSSFSLFASNSTTTRAQMSSQSFPQNRVIVGVGGLGLDFLATVATYPNPDDKIRSTSAKRSAVQNMNNDIPHVGFPITYVVQGGGNAGNALTCAARLGLFPRIISKIASDPQGQGILEELKADGVNTTFLVMSKEGNSPFTYVIVDSQTKTRTCIHSPGYPPLIPEDLSPSKISSALDGARLLYSDARLPEIALLLAREASYSFATRIGIPLLIDAERKREGLDDLLNLASYVVCASKFPQSILASIAQESFRSCRNGELEKNIARPSYRLLMMLRVYTEAPSIPSALVSILLRLPNIKFVIVTLGEEGCMMLQRSENGDPGLEEINVDSLLESLKQRRDNDSAIPACYSSPVKRLTASGIGTLSGRLFVGTAEKVPQSELVDTTGAGDAFIGAVLYALCTDMPPEIMLPFAAQVAALGCRALGARTGLPRFSDPRLAPFLHHQTSQMATAS